MNRVLQASVLDSLKATLAVLLIALVWDLIRMLICVQNCEFFGSVAEFVRVLPFLWALLFIISFVIRLLRRRQLER